MNLSLPMPIMAFASTEGLDRPLWNTIRLGRGWAKRVANGDTVILAHKDRALGVAMVESAEWGRVPEIVEAHWSRNHSGMGRDEMLDALVRAYGPHKVTPASWLSVVYLTPLRGQHDLSL